MVEEGFWLNLLYRGGDSGMGVDSRGIKYRPILTHTLLDALDDKGLKALEEGDKVLYIIDDIYDAVWAVRQYLSCIARLIKRYEEIFQVATTAANGDKNIGELVAKAIEKVGKDGLFAVYRRPLLIVAEDVDMDLVRSLRLDRSCRGTKLCVVKPPECENNGKAIMQELAVLTGGQVVTSESKMNFIPEMLGSCKEVTVSCDTMAILGRSGGQEEIEERRKQAVIRNQSPCSCNKR